MILNPDDNQPSKGRRVLYPVHGSVSGYGVMMEVRSEWSPAGTMRIGELTLQVGPGEILTAKLEVVAETA